MNACDFVVWCPSEAAETTLGAADYSYEFVLRQFVPVLQQLGRVQRVSDPSALDGVGAGGDRPLFLSFAPPHRTPRPTGLRTIPVFAWEFDRLPDEGFGGNPDNDWRIPLTRCGSAISHSQFAVDVTPPSVGCRVPDRVAAGARCGTPTPRHPAPSRRWRAPSTSTASWSTPDRARP